MQRGRATAATRGAGRRGVTGTVAVALVAWSAFATAACDDPLQRARDEAVKELRAATRLMLADLQRARAAAARRRAAARAAGGRAAGEWRAELAATLARIARTPDAPGDAGARGTTRLHDLPGIGKARLERVPGNAAAWSWTFHPGRLRAQELGPPRAVRDLLPNAPAHIGGFPVRGIWLHVTTGPLRGAVILDGPAVFTRRREMLVATVPYLQERMAMLLGPICDAGLVPGTQRMNSLTFKDRCRSAVAARLRRARLKWPPWNVRRWSEGGVSNRQCDRDWRSTVEANRRTVAFRCTYEARTGKVSLEIDKRRGRRR